MFCFSGSRANTNLVLTEVMYRVWTPASNILKQ